MTRRLAWTFCAATIACSTAEPEAAVTTATGVTAGPGTGTTAGSAADDATTSEAPGTTAGPVEPDSSSGAAVDDTSDGTNPFDDDSTGEPLPPPFDEGNVFVVGFNDRMVFEYDSMLEPVSTWTHPSFDGVEGPAGMVFDADGFLVVAAYDQFCVFSAPNQIDTCHPKITPQRTENIIFDIFENLYTTTSTGGTDEIHKYDGDYNHLDTFDLPTGQLTGVTCDPNGDLFVASQTGAVSTIYKVDGNALTVLDDFTVTGNAEGLQFAPDGNLLVALAAGVGIARVTPSSPSTVIDTISHPGLFWPVPLTIDGDGNRYTGDFENGTGSAAADLFVFDESGAVVASREPSELFGPFGLVVAGTSLPCGAVPPR
ncbi:MAG: hypothetical protein AAF721_10665 [Myxococcota bacterium]